MKTMPPPDLPALPDKPVEIIDLDNDFLRTLAQRNIQAMREQSNPTPPVVTRLDTRWPQPAPERADRPERRRNGKRRRWDDDLDE